MEVKERYVGIKFTLNSRLFQIHFDWAISRGDDPRDVEKIGREIERMDNDLQRIREDIEEIDRSRFNPVPLKSLKTHKF